MRGIAERRDMRQRTEPGQGPARGVRGKAGLRVCPHHVQARDAMTRTRLAWRVGSGMLHSPALEGGHGEAESSST